jgi:hypothetical protein
MTELSYTLNVSHIAAYQRLASERASNSGHGAARGFDNAGELLAAGVVVAVPLAAVALLLPLATGRSFAYVEFLFGLLLGIGLVTGGLWFRYRKVHRQAVRPGGPTLSEHHLKLGGDGLRTSSPFFENICRWHAIEEATVHETVVVLWLEPGMGVVVPRSAFANTAAEADFVDRVRALVVEAKLPRAGTFA